MIVVHFRGNAAKVGLNRTTHWVAIYFTNIKSRFPKPERAMFLLAMPVIQPLPAVPMTPQCVQVMRDWAQTFGVAVPQRSIRQETTMARAGTLPYGLYQREVRLGESVSLERPGEQRGNKAEKVDEEDSILEYDSSSSKDLDDESFSTNNVHLIMRRPSMMLVEFRCWIARKLFCLERFHVSEELFASIAELWFNCSELLKKLLNDNN